MTKRNRRTIDAALKAKIALEALREQATVTELAHRSDFVPECGDGSFFGLAQMCFEFCKGHFDGIEIRRVQRVQRG